MTPVAVRPAANLIIGFSRFLDSAFAHEWSAGCFSFYVVETLTVSDGPRPRSVAGHRSGDRRVPLSTETQCDDPRQ